MLWKLPMVTKTKSAKPIHSGNSRLARKRNASASIVPARQQNSRKKAENHPQMELVF